jgi:hypothetical protein
VAFVAWGSWSCGERSPRLRGSPASIVMAVARASHGVVAVSGAVERDRACRALLPGSVTEAKPGRITLGTRRRKRCGHAPGRAVERGSRALRISLARRVWGVFFGAHPRGPRRGLAPVGAGHPCPAPEPYAGPGLCSPFRI